uniref:N-acetylgalactosaminide beta-1,3-galactosyltransferase n=1 Tax=Syphacia muris TaxID=451379 RepID=A0A0N5AC35_9BILA
MLLFSGMGMVRHRPALPVIVLFVAGIVFGAVASTLFWYSINFADSSVSRRNFDSMQPAEKHDISSLLYKNVKVFCWIMSGKFNRSMYVEQTWVKRCNKYIFVTSKPFKNLSSVVVDVPDGRDYLWAKTKAAFKHIYDHEDYLNYDWFLKADDDTYVIMENLRYMLLPYSANDPLYLGSRIKTSLSKGYNSGGAGYVLSRKALTEFVTQSLPYSEKCNQDHSGDEDVEMGKCMESLSIYPIDTRDGKNGHRFMVDTPGRFLDFDPSFLFYHYTYYPMEKGFNGFSKYSVSFHYVDPKLMLTLEYLLYYAEVYGRAASISNTDAIELSKIVNQSMRDVGKESILLSLH